MVTNVFDIEQAIKAKLIADGVFASNLVFTNANAQDASNKMFIGVPDADANACLIIYNGYKVHSEIGSATKSYYSHTVLKYQLIVLSPEKLYKTNAGVKFVDAIKSLKTINAGDVCGIKGHLVNGDNHLAVQPSFTNNVVGLSMFYEFRAVI